MVNKAIHIYEYAPTGEAKLTIPAEIEEAIRGLKVGEVSDPNDVTIKGPKRSARVRDGLYHESV
jgi:hypothetical protein